MVRRPAALLASTLFATILIASLAGQAPPRLSPDIYGQLRWRFIGPEGNRISAVVGVPGDPLVYYAGSASGGIAKTVDGGVHWQQVFDEQPVQSIGSLAVAASDPNIVWAGTGEAWIRSHISIGEGIYKSSDAGKTWTRMGLEKTGRIGRVVIDPGNPQNVLACALGTAYGPQQERGVFRTTDGGATWQSTLFVDENTGCSEIAMDPRNPRILFAGMWQIEIHTWGRESGGPGSGLFVSRDGGATWRRLAGHGLPSKPVGKVMPAIAFSNPNRIYASIETGDGLPWKGQDTDRGQLWRSDDGGENWKMVNADRNVLGRTAYYARMAVSTDNENETYYLNASFSRSIDAGATLVPQSGLEAPGGDHHDMWIDPANGNRMIVGHDQGVSVSQTRGRTWLKQRLPNAQLYHVTVDSQIPYYVYTNKQDGPSYRGPSNSRLGEGGRGGGRGGIPRGMWHSIGGGESGFATPDPTDPNVIWSTASGSGSVGGIVVRYEESRRQLRDVEVWPDDQNGPAADLKYRFVWDAPFHISPHDHNRIYIGSQYLHQSTDGGQSWQEISPDLTLNDKSRQQSSGGLTPDNIGVEYADVIHAIAESPKQAGLIWIGTNDGLVQVTRDGGTSWTNVTKNIPNLPPLGTVGNIEPSRHDAGTAYVAIDLHQVDNRDPFVYKTNDFGATWKPITNGIAHTMLSYAHCVREDPVRRGLLYLGTENGVYVSFDDGDNWQPLQMNLPHAPAYWLVVQEQFHDLVVATYGRGAWILDDVTPLRELTPQVLAAGAQLFAPRPAYRFRAITAPATPYDDPTSGDNPPYGADINYYVGATAAGGSGGTATITIADAKGQTVRTMRGSASPGINRVYWDLRDTPSARVAFRTSPLYAPEIRIGPDGLRESEGGFGAAGGGLSVLQAPGTYTVKLSVGGHDYTQPLRILKDPHSAGTEADIAAQQQLLLAVRRDLDTAVDAVNNAEVVRAQIRNMKNLIDNTELRKAADDLDQRVAAAEGQLVELRATGRGQDGVRWGAKLVQKFGYLANGVQSGDFKPTNQQAAVGKELSDRLKASQTELGDVFTRDVAAFNDMLRRANLPPIATQVPRRPSSPQP